MATFVLVFSFVFGVFCVFFYPVPLSVSLPDSVCAAEGVAGWAGPSLRGTPGALPLITPAIKAWSRHHSCARLSHYSQKLWVSDVLLFSRASVIYSSFFEFSLCVSLSVFPSLVIQSMNWPEFFCSTIPVCLACSLQCFCFFWCSASVDLLVSLPPHLQHQPASLQPPPPASCLFSLRHYSFNKQPNKPNKQPKNRPCLNKTESWLRLRNSALRCLHWLPVWWFVKLWMV